MSFLTFIFVIIHLSYEFINLHEIILSNEND